MRVHVVSDVHGNAEALAQGRGRRGRARRARRPDRLRRLPRPCQRDPGRGVRRRRRSATFARLRAGARARRGAPRSRARCGPASTTRRAVVEEAVREQYARLFAAMTAPTYATPGNVDVPALWPEFAGDGRAGSSTARRPRSAGCGSASSGGALLPPGRVRRRGGAFRPYLRTEEDFAAARRRPRRGRRAVHAHPAGRAGPDLRRGRAARRSTARRRCSDLIHEQAPRWAVFGHVHQPLSPGCGSAYTECANVGHFQRTQRPYVLRW